MARPRAPAPDFVRPLGRRSPRPAARGGLRNRARKCRRRIRLLRIRPRIRRGPTRPLPPLPPLPPTPLLPLPPAPLLLPLPANPPRVDDDLRFAPATATLAAPPRMRHRKTARRNLRIRTLRRGQRDKKTNLKRRCLSGQPHASPAGGICRRPPGAVCGVCAAAVLPLDVLRRNRRVGGLLRIAGVLFSARRRPPGIPPDEGNAPARSRGGVGKVRKRPRRKT